MKKFRYSFVLFLFVILASCSKDDDDNPSVDTSILTGEWNLEEMGYNGTSSVNFGGTTMATSYTGELIQSAAKVIFSDDNKFSSNGSYTVKLTTNMDDMTDVQNVPVSFSGTGTYYINGNILTTNHENFNTHGSPEMLPVQLNEATISELTSTRMVLTFNYTETTTMEGMDVEITMEGFQVLTKSE